MSLENNTNELNQILEMVENIKPNSTPETTVYVHKEEPKLRQINSEDTLELGQTIYVDTSKLSSTAYYEINTDNGQLVLTITDDYFGWGISGCGLFGYGDFQPDFIQALTPNSGMVEYASHLSGKITSLTDNTPFYIYPTSKAVYNEQGETKQLDLSLLSDETGLLNQGGGAPTFEEIETSKPINLEVGQTFNNQEVVIEFNWSGYETPEGSITFDNGNVFSWYFATDDPYIIINGTSYHQSQGIEKVETTLNGTITNIDSHAYGAGYEIPLTNVITKVTTKGKVITDLLVRTEDSSFGYVDKDELIKNGSEKVIHITKYTAENIISFSMQGYSHFQILSGKTNGESGNCEMLGMVANKNDSYCDGSGHFGATGSGYWAEKPSIPISYDESNDIVSLNTEWTPLNYFNNGDNGLSVYIRLLNVEEV